MASVPPPNEFSQHLARWVYQKSLPSVVLVTYNAVDPDRVRQHLEKIHPNENRTVQGKMANKRRAIGAQQRCATGFVVQASDDNLMVLTCAHALDHVFTDSYPITADEISELFNVQILCNHSETRYRLGQAQRQTVPAEAVQVDCRMDLLLLRVQRATLAERCQEPHPAVSIAESFPESLDKVVVVSWPPYRPQTKCVGITSHEGREYADVFEKNPYGYNMMLSEVCVLTDTGSSGAPMLNGDANAVGVLHGGAQSSLCYFTSLPDLRDVLTDWGVVGHANQ